LHRSPGLLARRTSRPLRAPRVALEVGVMCAAPEGPGFDATFDQLEISQLK